MEERWPVTLPELQRAVDLWIKDHGGYWHPFQILARLTEELGEVAGALQRESGLRPRKSDAALSDELGDVLFTLTALANSRGLDLQASLEHALAKYTSRDSEDWKKALAQK